MDNSGAEGRPAVTPRWSVRLFGGFKVTTIEGAAITLPGKRERIVLAYLLMSPDCRQPRRKLASLLWGDTTEEAALHNLRTCIWGVRNALGDPERRLLVADGEDISLEPAMFEVDAWALRDLARKDESLALEKAAALYIGSFLDGLDLDNEPYESWQRTEAVLFRDQVIDILMRLMARFRDAGEMNRVLQLGQRLLNIDPMHEGAVRALMHVYAKAGRRAAAVQLYQSLARVLRAELDVEPEPETRRVFAELTQSPLESATPKDLEAPRTVHPSLAMGIQEHLPIPAVTVSKPSALHRGLVLSATALIALVGFLSYRYLVFAPPASADETVVPGETTAAVDPVEMSPHLSGTSADDMIFGLNDEDHEIRGLDGDDTIHGANGNDSLYGNNGSDILFGENGDDILTANAGSSAWLFGGAGSDTANYFTNNGRSGVNVDLRILGPQLVGLGGSDGMSEYWHTLSSIENINGSRWDDVLTGDAGGNVLTGNAGGDILTGGEGNDTFVYKDASHGTGDRITDFGHGKDTIDLSAIDSGDGGAGDFEWGATTATANGVWYEERGGNTILQADVNGDATADFQITLVGTRLKLTAANCRL